MNKYVLLIGIAIIAIAALMMFCQERCFLGVDLETWPAALGIVGIALIGASQVISMKQRKR